MEFLAQVTRWQKGKTQVIEAFLATIWERGSSLFQKKKEFCSRDFLAHVFPFLVVS